MSLKITLRGRCWLGILWLSLVSVAVAEDGQSFPQPPGIVIDHSPASSGLYIGSPSLAVLSNGTYLASHDLFGPKSLEFERPTTVVFRSLDRGFTWSRTATLPGVFWNNLFAHHGAAYLMGTDRHHGRVVIRRSVDGGGTWTEPRDAGNGLLAGSGQFHTAPMPVVEHGGRLWRAFEDAMGGTEWGKRYRAGMLSVPVDSDLLQATNWTFSTFLSRDAAWLGGRFNAWLEGNAVVGRDGRMLNILRVDTADLPEMAACVEISGDGRVARFNPTNGFMPFPGGAKKFVIRHDKVSDKYWALATPAMDIGATVRPAGVRNRLALMCSADLRTWEIRAMLFHHPDVVRHGFQYPDWDFEGDDIIAVVRTAWDDAEGGARNNHDANYMTFHRFAGFRRMQATREAIATPAASPAPSPNEHPTR